ncbi:unnamed protein product [Clonostachys rosea f. rosea IK726]|uniref:Uncharacterized protein n=1 Tax=Clonostachys rosea f. rosea IK726 TaxID=1349383 RepID=A0ACA9TWT4_BIOOC|nr:unnamed protein product [Clonostachys rosea f. rosea IK726]
MSFEPADLTKGDDFFADAPISAAFRRRGQRIYWKGCTIKIYESGKESTAIREIKEKTNGEAYLLAGTSVLCEGGPAKEV